MNGKHTAETTAAKGGDWVKVTFVCDIKPDAKQVYLAGDFSDWESNPIRMAKRKGSFCKRMDLSPGKYQYKFLVDGEWHMDPTATGALSAIGTMNSVVQV